jgi:hypothetical protein
MDTFGSVDPYALMLLEGIEYRTGTVKSSYTPEWNETFTCDIMDMDQGCRSDFVVKVNDWDAASKDDEVGSFTIPASRMSEIVRAAIGSDATDTFNLYLGGKVVLGHDKEPSEVTVRVRVAEVPKAFATLEVDPEAKGPRKVELTVVSARHLPKVDIMTGKCDPYVMISFPGFGEFKTEVIKKTYNPDWEQSFSFDVADVLDDCCSDFSVTVMDYDMATAHDKVGSSVVPKFRMTDLFRGTNDWEADEVFVLMDRGQPVRGHDGDIAVVTIRFRVFDVQRHVGVVITVLSAMNLPCMEPLPPTTRCAEKTARSPATDADAAAAVEPEASQASSSKPQADGAAASSDRLTVDRAEDPRPDADSQSTHAPANQQRQSPRPLSGSIDPAVAGPGSGSSAQHDDDAAAGAPSAAPATRASDDGTLMHRPSPYCSATLGSKEACTSTRHRTFECSWQEEEMTLEVRDRAALILRVSDDDVSCLHDPMGQVTFTWAQVASLIRGRDGYFEERTLNLLQDGKPVLGCDGKPARLSLRLKVVDWTDEVTHLLYCQPRRQHPQKRNR